MRCFLAVNFSSDFKNQLLNKIQILQNVYPKLKWVKEGNIHLTLKFYGDIGKESYEILSKRLMDIKGPPFQFSIMNLISAFPGRDNPRVFWIGIAQHTRNKLIKMSKHVENLSFVCGFPREKRKFAPHLTIARVPKSIEVKQDFWELCKNIDFINISSKIEFVYLMESKLSPKGPQYSILNVYSLNDHFA